MNLNKKALFSGLLSYMIWGLLPAFWNLLIGVNPLLILCGRIVFAFVSTAILLAVTGRIRVVPSIFKDKTAMRNLIPASVLITFNWGLYVWAINSGHILDASLGYYMNPLMVFLFGIIIFREKTTKLQLVAVALAFTGVLISVIAYGSFPFISVGLSLTFAAYGVLKKKAGADPVAGITVESLMITPFALVFMLVFLTDGLMSVNVTQSLLLALGGALTAAPLVLFARAINDIPFIIVGFLQYLSPTLMLIYGLIAGETLSAPQIVSYSFIGLGLIVFSIALVSKDKRRLQA